jgi:serine/threonine protein kinase
MDVPQRLGKYEIRGTLGRGAMGVVYDGFDPQIARRVAIKSVPLPDNPDPDTQEEIARFRREAQAAGRLTHPNIVGVYDYGETNDVAYIVMEHVDGPTLKTLLDKKERFPLDNIARVMGDLLAGLQFSHERGVVHRDIKPGNIMLTKGGQAKIADFGIARIEMSSMTQAGTMLGTPAYMSPEQFRGEVADARTDVYSAGVLLYQLLTGDRPFEGGLTTIMHKVLNTDPPAPSQLASTAPAALDAVVRKAMAKRPEDRYASATAFADALRAALAAPAKAPAAVAEDDDGATLVRPATPRPAPPAPPSSPPPAAAKSKAPLFAGVGIAALLVLGGAGWFFTRATPPPEQVAQVVPPVSAVPTAPETKPAATVAPTLADAQATPQPSTAPSTTAPSTTAPATTTATEPPPTPPPVTPQPVTPPPVVVAQPVVTKPPATAPIVTQPAVTQPAVTQPATSKPVVASKPAEPPPTPPPPAQPTTTTTLAVEPPAPPPAALAPPARLPAPPPAQTTTTTTAAATPVQPTPVQPSLVQPATKPAEPLATAVPAVPVPQLPPPPPPAAQTAATTAPIQTAAAASAILAQIAQAVHAASCTLATVVPQDSGTLTVQGVGDGAAMAALRRQVDTIQGAPPTIWLVRTIDPAFCPVLALLRPISPLAGAPGPGVGLTLANNRVVLPDGDAILPRLTMPDFAGEMRVDYLSRDGSVAHLYPTLADNSDPAAKLAAQPSRRLAAGEHLALGDPGPGKPQWQSGTPYGTDMIVAVASSTPLHVAPAHNAEEKADAYLADLDRAIEQARAAGARVSGALLLVETVAKK